MRANKTKPTNSLTRKLLVAQAKRYSQPELHPKSLQSILKNVIASPE